VRTARYSRSVVYPLVLFLPLYNSC